MTTPAFSAKAQHQWRQRAPMAGFTLIELMTVLSIVAIMLGVGIPTFRSFILSQRVTNASYDLAYTLNYARSEAIKRNTQVTVVPVTSSAWGDGWSVTTGSPATTLSQQSAFTSVAIAGPAGTITYGTDGRLSGAASPTFQIQASSYARCVRIDLSGLSSSKTGSC